MVLDNIRFPFTAGGFRFDLSHKKWPGLDSGGSFGFERSERAERRYGPPGAALRGPASPSPARVCSWEPTSRAIITAM